METRLVRLKAPEPRRGHLLRRFSYAGIKFIAERGWYRVPKKVADYLETVRQRPGDVHTPLAFDVCTDEAARAMEEEESARQRPTSASEAVRVSEARGAAKGSEEDDKSGAKGAARRSKAAG